VVAAAFALALLWTAGAHAADVDVPGVTPRDDATTRTARAEDAQNESRNVQTGSGDSANSSQTTGSGDSRNTQTNSQGGDGSDLDSSRDRDCVDFASQEAAQRFFDRHGGSRSNNVDNLDSDRDGIACEGLSSVSGAPVGGIDTGGGGTATASDGGSPLPFALGGAGLGLLVVLLASSLRRRPTA
jgi:hypothetical protein